MKQHRSRQSRPQTTALPTAGTSAIAGRDMAKERPLMGRRGTPRVAAASRVALVALLVWLSMPQQEVRAGACCASAAAFGVGRLLRWEKFAVGLRTTISNEFGQWDLNGNWLGHREDYRSIEWRSEIWGMVGIGKHVSLYARFPWLLNYRQSSAQDAFGGGIGDLQLGGRFDLVLVGTHKYAPGVALTLNLLMPTGRATTSSQSPLGTEVTGRGAWEISAGLLVEKVIVPWFIQLQLGVKVPLPSYREEIDQMQRFGVGVLVNLANGFEIVPNALVLTLVLRFGWDDDLELGGRRIPRSRKLSLGAILALAWRFHPHWTLQLSGDTGIFADHLGVNDLGRLTATLGIRYGYF